MGDDGDRLLPRVYRVQPMPEFSVAENRERNRVPGKPARQCLEIGPWLVHLADIKPFHHSPQDGNVGGIVGVIDKRSDKHPVMLDQITQQIETCNSLTLDRRVRSALA